MVVIVAGLFIIGMAIIMFTIFTLERKRLDSVKQTIRDSGKKNLEDILEWYPEEMHDEVTRMWEEVNAGK